MDYIIVAFSMCVANFIYQTMTEHNWEKAFDGSWWIVWTITAVWFTKEVIH